MERINIGPVHIFCGRELDWRMYSKWPISISLIYYYFTPPTVFGKHWRLLNALVGIAGFEIRVLSYDVLFRWWGKMEIEVSASGCLWPPFTFMRLYKFVSHRGYVGDVIGIFWRVTWFWIRIAWDDC